MVNKRTAWHVYIDRIRVIHYMYKRWASLKYTPPQSQFTQGSDPCPNFIILGVFASVLY